MLDRAPLSARTSIKIGIITFLVLTAISIGVQFSLPKTYIATARIEVTQTNQPQSEVDPYFVQQDFERIRSERVLLHAVEQLRQSPEAASFGKNWHTRTDDRDRARALLSRLDLRQSRNTSLIEIRFSDRNPNHAALIANTIARAYSAQLKASGSPTEARIIDLAQPPTHPSSPNIPLLLAFATFLNSILAILAGFFAANLFR